jgi:nucleoside-diphosphate-sugar epimerase
MTKLLITGSSGFIGSHFVEEAIINDYEVYAGVRSTSSKQYLTDPSINFVEFDLSDKEQIKKRLSDFSQGSGGFDYVIHNAGITKTNCKNDFDRINYQYTRNLIEALIETDSIPKKFIYISSLAAIGPGDDKTFKPVTLIDIPNPVSYYGKSKLKAELYINSLIGFPGLIFRPTGVYGPREKDYLIMYRMINKHIETYISTDQQHITFIYVKDLARLVIGSLRSNITHGTYFTTDGNYYTAKEFSEIVKRILNKKTCSVVFPKHIVYPLSYIVATISKLFGKTSTLNPEKYNDLSRLNWWCDAGNTNEDFGFIPKYNLFQGMSETLVWYKQHKLL